MSSTLRVLLTGARGMVGRNLLEHPGSRRVTWLAPDRATLDLLNLEAVRRYLAESRADFVIHAAGLVGGIQANVAEPCRYLFENAQMGLNVVRAARDADIKRLINLGSSCMYPRDWTQPLTEDQLLAGPLEPTNEGYALAKLAVARLCEYVCGEDSSLAYKTLIPCNLYGRHERFDPLRSHLIAATIHKLYRARQDGLKSVEIWGDGSARREFMYAGDLADAILRALDHFDSLPDLMNVGVGDDKTVREYYEAAAEIIGYEGQFTYDVTKPAGMERKLVSTVRQSEWGWRPKTCLQEGLARTYAYYLKERPG